MHKTLVIGANGQIGQLLIPELLDANFDITAVVRDKQSVVLSSDITLVEGNIETIKGGVFPAMENCDSVIFSAGSGAATGFDKTLLVDLWGACKVIDAAKSYGIKQFIMVSSRGADNPDNGPEIIKPYLIAKHFADGYLKNSGINYTILRPGRLTDENACGHITTERPQDPSAQHISRADTAHIIAHCLNRPSCYNKIYELYHGTHTIEASIQ